MADLSHDTDGASPPRVGEPARPFTLLDSTRAPRSLADLARERPQILIFYRGHL